MNGKLLKRADYEYALFRLNYWPFLLPVVSGLGLSFPGFVIQCYSLVSFVWVILHIYYKHLLED